MIARHRRRAGFSLVEVLLAVFILGIGVISVAAVFPAGIALQRQSNDDVLGPVVAQNALALLRARLDQRDFGSFADFNPNAVPFSIAATLPGNLPLLTVEGDWPWMRPGFIFDDPATPADEGAIDIFSQQFTRKTNGLAPFTPLDCATEIPGGWPIGATQVLWGIPYNPARYAILPASSAPGNLPDWRRAFPEPRVIVTQRERYWPMGSTFVGATSERPQYAWECMFRRFNGRVQVAIFVYRVSFPGGQPRFYSVAPGSPALNAGDCPSFPTLSPLPVSFRATDTPNPVTPAVLTALWLGPTAADFVNPPPPHPNPPFDPTRVPTSNSFDPAQPRFMWQIAGQWILDQNNNVHRVLAGRRNAGTDAVRLARPVTQVAPSAVFGVRPGLSPAQIDAATRAVLQAWYLPVRDANGVSITPVYILVEEL